MCDVDRIDGATGIFKPRWNIFETRSKIESQEILKKVEQRYESLKRIGKYTKRPDGIEKFEHNNTDIFIIPTKLLPTGNN